MHISHLIAQYGYAIVFLFVFLEAVGIPFPAETTLTLAGLAWGRGELALIPLLIVAIVAHASGSTIAYWIGYKFGEPLLLRFGRRFGVTKERLDGVEKKMRRFGRWVLPFSKFIAFVRVMVPYLIGINRLPFRTFFIINLISTVVWCTVFIIAGRSVEQLWKHYQHVLQPYLVPILIVVVLVVAVVMIIKKRKKTL